MGTRSDFYLNRGPAARYLGSLALDSHPEGLPDSLLEARTEADFVREVEALLSEHGIPGESGWPWPWRDSATTDYAYAFHEGAVRVRTGSLWHDWSPEEGLVEREADEALDLPDMLGTIEAQGPRARLRHALSVAGHNVRPDWDPVLHLAIVFTNRMARELDVLLKHPETGEPMLSWRATHASDGMLDMHRAMSEHYDSGRLLREVLEMGPPDDSHRGVYEAVGEMVRHQVWLGLMAEPDETLRVTVHHEDQSANIPLHAPRFPEATRGLLAVLRTFCEGAELAARLVLDAWVWRLQRQAALGTEREALTEEEALALMGSAAGRMEVLRRLGDPLAVHRALP